MHKGVSEFFGYAFFRTYLRLKQKFIPIKN